MVSDFFFKRKCRCLFVITAIFVLMNDKKYGNEMGLDEQE